MTGFTPDVLLPRKPADADATFSSDRCRAQWLQNNWNVQSNSQVRDYVKKCESDHVRYVSVQTEARSKRIHSEEVGLGQFAADLCFHIFSKTLRTGVRFPLELIAVRRARDRCMSSLRELQGKKNATHRGHTVTDIAHVRSTNLGVLCRGLTRMQGLRYASINAFEQAEADNVWLFRRSHQVDLLWDPSTGAATLQAREAVVIPWAAGGVEVIDVSGRPFNRKLGSRLRNLILKSSKGAWSNLSIPNRHNGIYPLVVRRADQWIFPPIYYSLRSDCRWPAGFLRSSNSTVEARAQTFRTTLYSTSKESNTISRARSVPKRFG